MSATRTASTEQTGESTVAGPAAIALSGHTGVVRSVAWSPDGALLATAADGLSSADETLRLWDAAGTLVAELPGQARAIIELSWSADSRLLAGAGTDGIVRLWSRDGALSSTIVVAADPPTPLAAMAWSPAGSLLATAVVQPNDPATPGQIVTLPAIVQLWQPDGSEVRSFEIEHTLQGIVHLAWSSDGFRLAAGGNDLHVWETSGTELFTVPGGEFDFHPPMAYSPDGNLLAYPDVAGTMQIHSLDDGTRMSAGSVGVDPSITFSPDSSLIAVASGQLLLVVSSDNPIESRVQAVSNGVESASVWSLDGQYLAVGVARRAVALAAADGSAITILVGCDGLVSALDWSPDGATIAAGFRDGQVCLWDVKSMT
ncbi:MAG: hypothetical protein M3439_10645 [Chloroflexota bacterium]|nr:hypothetical protein [Chloroflexota bacterium]